MVDYHCCAGALLHPWSYKKANLPAPDLTAHQQIGKLADQYLNLDVGATGQILGYYPMGTTKDYYYSAYGALAFTYEGRYGKEKNYLDRHVGWWNEMLATISRDELSPFPIFVAKK